MSLAVPDAVKPYQIYWTYALPIVLIHLLSLLIFVPYFFSWTGVVLMLLCTHFIGSFGINVCYHRMLTHHSFRSPKWFERFLVFLGVCCFQDTPARWVAAHRIHHNHSDHDEDPHTPLVNFLWSHVGWLLFYNREIYNMRTLEKYARDILRDPWYLFFERYQFAQVAIFLAQAAVFFLAGFAYGWMTEGVAAGVQFGSSLLVWGVLARTVLIWHCTWSVNSVTHLFGYRNFETGENSRNNWLVALLTFGEGWHNNHHEDASSVTLQHNWWEVDIIFYELKFLSMLGLVSDMILPKSVRHRDRQRPAVSGPE